ncbi:SH3 domain-containing protein [Thiomicrorhabdus indica]|uniref:SH3 domain-containing protein n=1 Tax=Thiomicrorhabdus indica TaxID=2267253 RepID=UPI00102DCDF9|nr:SH3 domain-containing protein [Thiomicrorhabdus indica]
MKKNVRGLIAMVVLGVALSGCDESPRTQTASSQSSTSMKHKPPAACDASTVITGKKYNVLGSGINVRKGPGASYEKIINQKATSIIKTTQYITIDDTTTVFEECTKEGWSWIHVTNPDWLKDSHRGWVASKFLDKGQNIGGDKYASKISSSALSPYTKQGYPKTIEKYGSRLSEIESLRRKAAEMAVDSGKCDYVMMSELSDSKSALNHLHFWVDCRNKQRIYLDEFQIKKGAQVLTQEEKSWDESSAVMACQQAIKDRALIPSEVDIHTILGTSFYKAPTTHNVVLRMDFDAKNALGTEIPYSATCHFEPGEVGTIDIQARQ